MFSNNLVTIQIRRTVYDGWPNERNIDAKNSVLKKVAFFDLKKYNICVLHQTKKTRGK
ncbi:hypothetical protein BH10ACI2_BH10ACI2_05210 [soil metagenome]